MADNFAGYFREQREENKRQREIGDLIRQRRLKEARGEKLTADEERAYREQIESREFGTYRVTPIPHKPENFGKGPTKSTRVMGHKFVPGSRSVDTLLGRETINSGTVYVRFVRPSRPQVAAGLEPTVYKYTNVPVAVYEGFRNSGSKGRYINVSLNSHNPTAVPPGSPEYEQYCSDL